MSVSKELVGILKGSENKGTKAYDTPATVTRVEGSTVWVHIPGGVDETPVKRTINAKAGDTVQVRVAGGSAWMAGNASNPPTDDSTANLAVDYAKTAGTAADSALKSAKTAAEAAEDAISTANSVHGIAVQAQQDAATAKDAADNASEYAARALGNLSTVQSVTETLNWITAHGTMTLTSDVALDPTHVYFVVDAGGDYTVGGTTYAIVTEPDVDDIATYYELTIDESLNNYVGTHLALDTEGLWLLPASSGVNKVLIATGAGSTYTTAGTYIIDDGGSTVAMFGENATIGISDGTQSYLYEDYHSLQMVDKEGNTYFYVSDLRSNHTAADPYGEGFYYVATEKINGNGGTDYNLSLPISVGTPTVTINGTQLVAGTDFTYSNIYEYPSYVGHISLTNPITQLTVMTVEYATTSQTAKAYTLGTRLNGESVGPMSVAEGQGVGASGIYSHSEGSQSKARGNFSHVEGRSSIASGLGSHAEGIGTLGAGSCSHSEGNGSDANGAYSHAQNYYTIAWSKHQTALGKYNVKDNADTYAVIIGNGTADNARSDALEVDWGGDVFLALDTTAASGTTDGDLYAAINGLGWASDVIV